MRDRLSYYDGDGMVDEDDAVFAASDLVGFVHNAIQLAASRPAGESLSLLEALADTDARHLTGVMPDDVHLLLLAACHAPVLAPSVTKLVGAWATTPSAAMPRWRTGLGVAWVTGVAFEGGVDGLRYRQLIRFLRDRADLLLTLLDHLMSLEPVPSHAVARWAQGVLGEVAADHELVRRAANTFTS